MSPHHHYIEYDFKLNKNLNLKHIYYVEFVFTFVALLDLLKYPLLFWTISVGILARVFVPEISDEELEEIVSENDTSGDGTIDFPV